jgi:putative chitinase
MTNLSEHFTLEELSASPTAKKLGLSNTPTPEHIENMKVVCDKILEPVRAHFGKPIKINSSYRAPAVNKAVGGATKSQHCNGEAVDFIVPGVDNKTVADWVGDHLEFDQVILEFYVSKNGPNSGWVHVSFKRDGSNRHQLLIATKSKAGGTVYTPVKDFDPSTVPGQVQHVVVEAVSAPAPGGNSTLPANPLAALQVKCGVNPANGAWGPDTYKAAAKHFGLTNNQAAHFFGQCAHESNNFKAFSENLNYSADGLTKIFRKYFPTVASTVGYARTPQKIANKVYSGRMGNGPESSGDGYKFRGRGPIQLTGKQNYQAFSDSIGRPDVMDNPDLVAGELAFESALWFFKKNGLLAIADKGIDRATITAVTKRVNGGTIGIDDRIAKTTQFAKWA